jgi:methionyl aminopeptidase
MGGVLGLNAEAVDLDKLKMAGRIAARVRDYARTIVKPGVRASEVCEVLERLIVELGGSPAFPCNFSLNDTAAHYTPGLGDDVVVPEGAVVKVDVGVHVDGFIADTATTIDLSGAHGKLLEASERALEVAVSKVKPYASLYEIGRAIELEIRSLGFKPIRNLSGHNILRYMVHGGLSIPNHADRSLHHVRIPPGSIIALEPFATNGKGLVVDKQIVNIYSYTGRKPKIALTEQESKLLEIIVERYKTLPFTPRWLRDLYNPEELKQLIKSLHAKGVLHGYPVLVEAGGGIVAQFEHTLYVSDSEVIIITQ